MREELDSRQFVVLTTASHSDAQKLQESLVEELSQCPILERRSSEIFSSDLGLGANIVAAGNYRISSFQNGRFYRLERHQRDKTARSAAAQVIEIKAFPFSRDAISALRVGAIGFYIGEDNEITTLVAHDETLRVADCNQSRVVYRRGFRFVCNDGIELSTIEWDPQILERVR